MEYLIGVGLALSVSLLARIAGLDRDRAFYPTVMIVIAPFISPIHAIANVRISASSKE